MTIYIEHEVTREFDVMLGEAGEITIERDICVEIDVVDALDDSLSTSEQVEIAKHCWHNYLGDIEKYQLVADLLNIDVSDLEAAVTNSTT